MALGQAAGVAAHLALQENVSLRRIDVDRMQRELVRGGQVLTYFTDIDHSDPAFAALQYYGTKGFFRDYLARSAEPLDQTTERKWLHLLFPGRVDSATSLPNGILTGSELKRELEQFGLAVSPASGPIRRGEFCRILYDATAKNTVTH
jgi:hypothetical protein